MEVIVAAEEVARNATNVARSDILLVTVLKVALEATVVEEEDTVGRQGMVEGTEAEGEVARNRLATLAAAMDTCRATAPRVRNATTAEKLAT